MNLPKSSVDRKTFSETVRSPNELADRPTANLLAQFLSPAGNLPAPHACLLTKRSMSRSDANSLSGCLSDRFSQRDAKVWDYADLRRRMDRRVDHSVLLCHRRSSNNNSDK